MLQCIIFCDDAFNKIDSCGCIGMSGFEGVRRKSGVGACCWLLERFVYKHLNVTI